MCSISIIDMTVRRISSTSFATQAAFEPVLAELKIPVENCVGQNDRCTNIQEDDWFDARRVSAWTTQIGAPSSVRSVTT